MLIGLAVRLIIPDTTALSARRALHQAGLAGLQDVRREVCWGFDLDETEAPQIAAERLLNVDVLVNYNKHRGRWWRGELDAAPMGEAVALRWGRAIVEDRDDPEPASMQRVLTARLRLTGLRVVRHATLWSLAYASTDDVDRRTQDAVRLLLANRHGQRATLLPSENSSIVA
ncbi:MAG TPA: hypothetical protein VGP33_13600 [Chloroflexota bacterium]|nr:hypothetical protein [Chloroflexota bacterium]